MPAKQTLLKHAAVREAVIFLSLLLFGVLLLPVAVYFVGQTVFGNYAGGGYGDFFSSLAGKLLGFEWAAWFLVLSPWLAVMTLRLMASGWRRTAAM